MTFSTQRHPRLLFFVTEDWAFMSHRFILAKAAIKAGYDVSLATQISQHAQEIEAAGIHLYPLRLHRSGMNVFQELTTLWQVIRIYKKAKPDIVHNVAVKPVLYGSIAALMTGAHGVVNALIGLGFVFTTRTPLTTALRPVLGLLFRLLFSRKNSRLILQNHDDATLFINQGFVKEKSLRLILGSGVDPAAYPATPERLGEELLVVLPARLLRDKGVVEFVEAARSLRDKGIPARFALVGEPDPLNPSSLTQKQIDTWQKENVIEYWGWRKDMAAVFAQANIVCLPSYREGLPKALLEAAACGEVVTTDVPGCREIVRAGVNGWLVPAQNAQALAAALEEAILQPDLRARYGAKGREMVEKEFAASIVIEKTLTIYQELLQPTEPNNAHA